MVMPINITIYILTQFITSLNTERDTYVRPIAVMTLKATANAFNYSILFFKMDYLASSAGVSE